MEKVKSQGKWEGKVSYFRLKGPTAQQVWPLVLDFYITSTTDTQTLTRVIKWMTVAQSRVLGRSWSGTACPHEYRTPARQMWGGPKRSWLSWIQSNGAWATRSWITIWGSSLGWQSCKYRQSTVMKKWVQDPMVVCWRPVQGWSFEDMVSNYDSCLQSIAKKMENSLS